MYSMQNEIEYDDSFVVPMENGCIVRPEIDTEDIALRGNGRAFYINYLSSSTSANGTTISSSAPFSFR